MIGLLRADWLRLRKRRSLQIIAIAIPLLAAFIFASGYRSAISSLPPPFDPQEYRQELIDEGAVQGASPEEAAQMLDQLVESQEQQMEQIREQEMLFLTRYAFPQSLLTILGSASFAFLGLILLAAITTGDEFSSGTIRTTLLASRARWRFLLVRVGLLAGVAVFVFAVVLLLGVLMPALLAARGTELPTAPPLDPGPFLVLVAGNLGISLAVIGFATFATVLVRSGSLTLVVALVYVAIEGAVLALLSRFPEFEHDGSSEWALNLLPVRGTISFIEAASRAAGRVADYSGEVVVRDLGLVWLPLAAVLAWGALFLILAFRRFGRMDIVE